MRKCPIAIVMLPITIARRCPAPVRCLAARDRREEVTHRVGAYTIEAKPCSKWCFTRDKQRRIPKKENFSHISVRKGIMRPRGGRTRWVMAISELAVQRARSRPSHQQVNAKEDLAPQTMRAIQACRRARGSTPPRSAAHEAVIASAWLERERVESGDLRAA
jgi:hypothetical protein